MMCVIDGVILSVRCRSDSRVVELVKLTASEVKTFEHGVQAAMEGEQAPGT
jgi:hypothetical protein